MARAASFPATAPAAASSRPREVPICGYAAVKALFAQRPAAIKRLFFDQGTGRRVGAMSGYLAAHKKIYRQVEADALERVAGTVHHGGIVAIVDENPLRTPTADDCRRWAEARLPVVVLDRVGNAHNLGAIVRTLAFFGIEHLVVAADERQSRPGESAYRVAEGGMEFVKLWTAPDLAALARDLRAAGFEVIGADVRGKQLRSLRPQEFAERRGGAAADGKPAPRAPVALVLGNEEAGLAPEVTQACSRLVRIPGSGRIESLNVSAAAAVLVAALVVER